MLIFIYTFAIVFVALVIILGLGSLLTGEPPVEIVEGEATAAMCTTQLLDRSTFSPVVCDEDFVIEQDMVYTYDSFNL